jgi:hypothetical protein
MMALPMRWLISVALPVIIDQIGTRTGSFSVLQVGCMR